VNDWTPEPHWALFGDKENLFFCQKSNHGSSIVFSLSLATVATGFEQLFQTMAGKFPTFLYWIFINILHS
jgi:hypothetical protein